MPDAYVATHADRMLAELKDLLRIPSISTDPAHATACREAAEWLASHLRELGCRRTTLLASKTHPVVYAEGPTVPDRPRVLVYGHYDVQPPDPLQDWISPPFEPTIRDGALVARGATDDKGQLFALIKAFETVTHGGQPPLNVRFLLEGQEESGGDVLLHLVRERPDLLDADIVLVADGPYYAPGWPSVEVGVRGLCYVEIVVRVLKGDLHSGLYGGVVPNAHEALVRVLAELKTATGRIRIPGFYDAVRRPSARERQSWAGLPFSEADFRRDAGTPILTGDRRYPVLERLWALPTLDIHGIGGGFAGGGIKTVIPAEARAKVSLRLVPDQEAATVFDQLCRTVRTRAPRHVDIDVHQLACTDPIVLDTEHPAFQHIDRAFRDVVGRGVAWTRSGGSLPILGVLGTGGAAVVLAGIGLPDDRPHAPNEKFEIEQFVNGVRVFARFFLSVGSRTARSER